MVCPLVLLSPPRDPGFMESFDVLPTRIGTMNQFVFPRPATKERGERIQGRGGHPSRLLGEIRRRRDSIETSARLVGGRFMESHHTSFDAHGDHVLASE